MSMSEELLFGELEAIGPDVNWLGEFMERFRDIAQTSGAHQAVLVQFEKDLVDKHSKLLAEATMNNIMKEKQYLTGGVQNGFQAQEPRHMPHGEKSILAGHIRSLVETEAALERLEESKKQHPPKNGV